MIVVRLLVAFAMVCLPIVLLVAASRRAENLIFLIFPIVGGIPAALGALLIFAPLERLLEARGLGHLQNVAIPLAGGLLIVVFLFVALALSGKLARLPARLARAPGSVVGALVLWSVLGAAWGVLWRVSDRVVVAMGLATGG